MGSSRIYFPQALPKGRMAISGIGAPPIRGVPKAVLDTDERRLQTD
jgi:hypothetical protein